MQVNLNGEPTKSRTELKIEAKTKAKQERKAARGYSLHCFRCKCHLKSKSEVHRLGNGRYDSKPLCEECYGEALGNRADAERERYEEERWQKAHPGQNLEDWLIEQAYLRKYGEY